MAMATPAPNPSLDELLCFALYTASRAVTSHYRPMLDELGLTYPQYLVMLALWEDGELSMKDLGERLRLDSGTLTPLLKRLEARGLVERRRSVQDERSVLVTPTEAGRAIERRTDCVAPAIQQAMGLDDRQMGRLRKQVSALADAVRAAPPPPPVP